MCEYFKTSSQPISNDQLIYHLFKVPVWHLKNKKLPTGIYDWCLEYKENNSSIERERSNRGGYQSLVSNNFNSFPYTDYIIKQLNFLPRFNLQSWWININNKGNYNITHIHPGSELSIVWHITDSDNSLVLEDPNDYSRNTLVNWLKEYEYSTYKLDGKEGDIIVFPAYIPHHVEPHTENSPRISIAFNLNRAN